MAASAQDPEPCDGEHTILRDVRTINGAQNGWTLMGIPQDKWGDYTCLLLGDPVIKDGKLIAKVLVRRDRES